VSTALFVVGYPISIAVICRWLPVVRERRTAWFVAHQLAVAAIVAGWALRGDTQAVGVNGTWLVVAAAWYLAAGRRRHQPVSAPPG
jgi:hypothetical protein